MSDHDSDVVLPNASFDIESEKPDSVVEQEKEQKVIDRLLSREAQQQKFPLIRQHIETLIEHYNDVVVLAQLPESERMGHVLGKAWFVGEMRDLLNIVESAEEIHEDELKEQLMEKAGKSGAEE